jgi:hypothetical protein
MQEKEPQLCGTMEFETWFQRLKEYAVKEHGFAPEAAESFDREAYKLFYDDDYTPEDALDEDMTNA